MNVKIPVVPFLVWRMDAHINGHAIAVGNGLTHARCQLFTVGIVQLMRQRRPPLAGHSRILPLLCGFGSIPQRGSFGNRHAFWRDDLGRKNAALAGEIERFPGALIYQR
ncbi:hypothetical protein PA13_1028740 [Pseudomonas aeruginosa HB13]|nr:hypothetical protein PA13_1028740 [Pseudomonas aeruginosa HB13]